jgi:hypothetical protein
MWLEDIASWYCFLTRLPMHFQVFTQPQTMEKAHLFQLSVGLSRPVRRIIFVAFCV